MNGHLEGVPQPYLRDITTYVRPGMILQVPPLCTETCQRLQAPFNVFGGEGAVEQSVKEEPVSEEEEETTGLIVNDLRICPKCRGKSYIRQGLCVNIYCELYE